jgi:gamma-glutamyltranspeptidase
MLLDGKAPLAGQILKLPNLAKTFRSVAEHGKDGFYKGRIAEAIVELIKSKGGVMELEDLAKHKTSFVEPIKYTYGGEVTVYEVSSCPRISFTYKFHVLSVISVLPTVKVTSFRFICGTFPTFI